MIDIQEILRGVSVLSFLFYVLKRIKKTLSMAISLPSPPPPQLDSSFLISRGACFASDNLVKEKLETQISGVNGIEKNDLCAKQENMFLDSDSAQVLKVGKVKGINLARNRPTCLLIPESSPVIGFGGEDKRIESEEIEVEGIGYFLASKKGRKEVMEDSYGISVDISGDPKQVRKIPVNI